MSEQKSARRSTQSLIRREFHGAADDAVHHSSQIYQKYLIYMCCTVATGNFYTETIKSQYILYRNSMESLSLNTVIKHSICMGKIYRFIVKNLKNVLVTSIGCAPFAWPMLKKRSSFCHIDFLQILWCFLVLCAISVVSEFYDITLLIVVISGAVKRALILGVKMKRKSNHSHRKSKPINWKYIRSRKWWMWCIGRLWYLCAVSRLQLLSGDDKKVVKMSAGTMVHFIGPFHHHHHHTHTQFKAMHRFVWLYAFDSTSNCFSHSLPWFYSCCVIIIWMAGSHIFKFHIIFSGNKVFCP